MTPDDRRTDGGHNNYPTPDAVGEALRGSTSTPPRLRAHTSAGRTQLATWPTRPTSRANYREFLGGSGGGGGSLREMRGRGGRVRNSPRR